MLYALLKGCHFYDILVIVGAVSSQKKPPIPKRDWWFLAQKLIASCVWLCLIDAFYGQTAILPSINGRLRQCLQHSGARRRWPKAEWRSLR